ncbi:hypothetical protein [Streptomyces sp. NPDC006668]|uniref:hypothetical protein n=1 Tax=Streptomyces sp. NPDC006668 TaxID=3156903 RepID=UPI0033D7038D
MSPGATLGGLLTAGLALGAPAAHASGPGSCAAGDGSTGRGGDGCLYYHPDQVGGYYGYPYNVNYQGKTFGSCNKGSSAGDGQSVGNNAAWVQNWDTACTLYVWVYPLGTSNNIKQTIAPWTAGNLNSTLRNNNASQTWGGPGDC